MTSFIADNHYQSFSCYCSLPCCYHYCVCCKLHLFVDNPSSIDKFMAANTQWHLYFTMDTMEVVDYRLMDNYLLVITTARIDNFTEGTVVGL